MFEADVPGDLGQLAGVVFVHHLRFLVQDVHDLVERSRRREKGAVELRELLHRVEEVLDVEQEREQGSQADVAVEVEVTAVAEHHGERDR